MVPKRFETVTDLDTQSTRLEAIALSLDHSLEIGMRNLAQKNQIATEAVQHIDNLLISFAKELFEKRLKISSAEALQIAQLEYAAFVGLQMIWPSEVIERGPNLSMLFHKMLTAYLPENAPRETVNSLA